jgi:hypothetical protein
MTQQNSDRVSELVAEPTGIVEFGARSEERAHRTSGTPGLSAHVRQLRNRNQGISRWLILAIFAGAAVALAMVQFAIH